MTKISQSAARWLTTVALSVVAGVTAALTPDADASEDRDRGDVPGQHVDITGWVMITVMTVTSRSTCLT